MSQVTTSNDPQRRNLMETKPTTLISVFHCVSSAWAEDETTGRPADHWGSSSVWGLYDLRTSPTTRQVSDSAHPVWLESTRISKYLKNVSSVSSFFSSGHLLIIMYSNVLLCSIMYYFSLGRGRREGRIYPKTTINLKSSIKSEIVFHQEQNWRSICPTCPAALWSSDEQQKTFVEPKAFDLCWCLQSLKKERRL